MTLSPQVRIYPLLAATFAAGFGLGLLMAQAQAFTFEGQTTVTGTSSSNYNNPVDSRFSSGGNSGQTTIKHGNTTLQFGGQRSLGDSRYYPEQLFNPNGRPGDAR
jgi:hypothetical protein